MIPNHLPDVRPWWTRVRPTAHYLVETEAHVYALAIAASVLLAFFPFLIVMISVCRDVLKWPGAVDAIQLAVKDLFAGKAGEVIDYNIGFSWYIPKLSYTSILLLLFTANGIFEPLEVALNRAWGVTANRSYLKNQAISLGMVVACGVLALVSLRLTALGGQFLTHAPGFLAPVSTFANHLFYKLAAIPVSIFALFLVYWLLPNRKVDPGRVAPVAIVVGLVLEGLKYLNMLLADAIHQKLDREYKMFEYSATILLWSFVAALVVLAGAHWTARRDTVDPLS
ncbi:MAG TPA: YihY/virulence factor BrkB family protein [Bryobacteraceae bacterium]|nr:YihY/virulence factor BrkB family protein [Bryobacteraceae bacterium]